MKNKNHFSLMMLTTLGFFIAIEIVLSRWLSFQTWNFKISFSFVPIVIVAMLYGPLASGMVAGIADVIGAILFPIGAYFPGFTFTAFFNGIVYGIFLKKKQSMPHVIIAVCITHLVGSLLLNTFWISMLYGTPFLALLPLRIGQNVVMMIVQIVVIPMISKLLVPRFKALTL
ncbi:folate family ECF transporter S component [Clostridium sp. Marseille-P299]|uniref:folate family ECF transporter S component n=1 Tax=Clostridium sp. Marseille-P299 TaxID=1805477 RepID=UPI000B0D461F|nr:folate family ECF transporter S component [Clostridium sp. Marseille-P299]